MSAENTVAEGLKKLEESGHEVPTTNYNAGEVIAVDPETGGAKGVKEIQLHAIPYEALAELGRVYAFGADKYDDYNFRKGYQWSFSFDALQRHLWAFWSGEEDDTESGLAHLAHAAWHCFTLLLFSIKKRGTDDRPR